MNKRLLLLESTENFQQSSSKWEGATMEIGRELRAQMKNYSLIQLNEKWGEKLLQKVKSFKRFSRLIEGNFKQSEKVSMPCQKRLNIQ